MADVCVKLAEADTRRRGERLKVAGEKRRATGRAVKGCGLGYKMVGPKGNRRVVVDEEERKVMARIVDLLEEGLSWEKIAMQLMRDGIKTRAGRDWGMDRVRKGYFAELELRANPPSS